MNVKVVARVVQGWLDGRRIVELAEEFPGEREDERIRKAATYMFSTVSQTVAWGAHAYLRSWGLGRTDSGRQAPEEAMLPAYIQHGVHTPEAAVVSLLSVPRQVAEPLASVYRGRNGPIRAGEAKRLREFVEQADVDIWREALRISTLDVDPGDMRAVWRQMRGLPAN